MKKLQFKIQKFKEKQAKQVCKLVTDCFNKFVAPAFSLKGRKEFLSKITSEKFVERSKSKKREYYVAVRNNQVIGVIGMKKNQRRIGLLFVDKRFHRKGVAKALVGKIEPILKKESNKSIKTRSSLYAVKFYEKMGYKKSTGLIKSKGMIYQPMRKLIS